MRAIITSDWHLDATTHGKPRFQEVHQQICNMLAYGRNNKATHFFFCGDLCDIGELDVFKCLRYVCDTCNHLSAMGIKSYWINGNHDASNGQTVFDPLVSAFANNPDHKFFNTVQYREDSGIDLLFLPYPTKEVYGFNDSIRKVLSTTKKDNPLFCFSHMSVKGMPLGEESYEMAKGATHILPVEELEANAMQFKRDVRVFQGHYHRGQVFRKKPIHIEVIGAPAKFTYRESTHVPRFLWVEHG